MKFFLSRHYSCRRCRGRDFQFCPRRTNKADGTQQNMSCSDGESDTLEERWERAIRHPDITSKSGGRQATMPYLIQIVRCGGHRAYSKYKSQSLAVLAAW